MGFLLWQPQLLSEPWDRVSSGNNQRPLEKIHSEPGNRQREQGLGGGRGVTEGEAGVGQRETETGPCPFAPLRGTAQVDEALDTDTGTPLWGGCWGPTASHQAARLTTSSTRHLDQGHPTTPSQLLQAWGGERRRGSSVGGAGGVTQPGKERCVRRGPNTNVY